MSIRLRGPSLLLLLLLSLLAACSDTDTDTDTDTATTRPPVTAGPPGLTEAASDATSEAEAEVEAAYLAYWEMFDRLVQAPDPEDPEIEQRASGQALQEVQQGLADMVSHGYVAQLGDAYGHEVLDVDLDGDDAATVTACSVDDSMILDSAGAVISTEPASGVLQVGLRILEGEWRVDHITTVSAQPGPGQCEA